MWWSVIGKCTVDAILRIAQAIGELPSFAFASVTKAMRPYS